jgi:hypothetical protein
VEDDIHSLHCARRRSLLAEVALDELDATVQVREVSTAPGRQVVDDAHRLTHFCEPRGDMRADETRPAGDEPGA